MRLQQLLHYDQATSYKKQKDSLQRELQAFLGALPGFVNLATVTPRDLCRFLIFKDKRGKTQVHLNTCEFLGQRGNQSCGCPLRLSYKTGILQREVKIDFPFHWSGRSVGQAARSW